MSDYVKKAKDFLDNTNTNIKIIYLGENKYFPGDKEKRDTYYVILENKKHEYKFTFGDSIANTEARRKINELLGTPGYSRALKKYKENKDEMIYSILSGLDVFEGDYFDFLDCFGYEDNRESQNIYNKVIDQSENLKKLFNNDELEVLRSIN